jgi:lysophospholipase L1-like esterase
MFATNELGWRDDPYRPDADVQVLLLGDSVAWGDGISTHRVCFPFLTEELLGAMLAPRTVELVNASAPGYSTFQEAAYLRLEGERLAPDAVVLSFCLNDVTERYTAVAAYGGDNVFLGVDTRGGRGWFAFLLRNSRAFEHLVRWRQTRSRDRAAYKVANLAQDSLPAELEEAWETVLGEVDDVRGWCAARGTPLVLLILPYRFPLADPRRTRQPQDRLMSYARERGVLAVDLLPAMAAHGPDAGLFHDANHLLVPGHRLVAQGLAQALRRVLPGQ